MQIIKKRREKGRRAENLGVNPHSKGLNFSRSIFSLNLKKFPKNNKIKDNIIGDPQVRIYLFSLGLNWLSIFRGVVFLPQIFWLRGRQIKNSLKFFIMYLLRELGSIFRGLVIPGTMLIFLSLFFLFSFQIF